MTTGSRYLHFVSLGQVIAVGPSVPDGDDARVQRSRRHPRWRLLGIVCGNTDNVRNTVCHLLTSLGNFHMDTERTWHRAENRPVVPFDSGTYVCAYGNLFAVMYHTGLHTTRLSVIQVIRGGGCGDITNFINISFGASIVFGS